MPTSDHNKKRSDLDAARARLASIRLRMIEANMPVDAESDIGDMSLAEAALRLGAIDVRLASTLVRKNES